MSKKRSSWKYLGFFVILAVVVGLSCWKYSTWVSSEFPYSRENRGLFGDQFGMLNALFSGLAFAGMIVTLWMQREELSLQRKELTAAVTAHQETARQLKAQKEIDQSQVLFQALDLAQAQNGKVNNSINKRIQNVHNEIRNVEKRHCDGEYDDGRAQFLIGRLNESLSKLRSHRANTKYLPFRLDDIRREESIRLILSGAYSSRVRIQENRGQILEAFRPIGEVLDWGELD